MTSPITMTVWVGPRPFTVEIFRELDPGWLRAENDLCARGIPRPLVHTSAWIRAVGTPHVLFTARPPGEPCSCAFALCAVRTRAMPGHVVLRGERIGAAQELHALSAALEGVVRFARTEPRVLRLELATFNRHAGLRASLNAALAGHGLSRARDPQSYTTTQAIDLGPSEEDLLARFHPTARRHLRAVAKQPVRLATIESERHLPAMRRLVAETRRRTGGAPPDRPFEALIALAASHPDLVLIPALFSSANDELLAFAVGQANGDHVCYADAASTRKPGLNVPLGYAPVWELMRWARRLGASWFDFAGITTGRHGDGDPLGGISDFKRNFGGRPLEVGDEWWLEPKPLRGAVARQVSRAAEWTRERMQSFARAPA